MYVTRKYTALHTEINTCTTVHTIQKRQSPGCPVCKYCRPTRLTNQTFFSKVSINDLGHSLIGPAADYRPSCPTSACNAARKRRWFSSGTSNVGTGPAQNRHLLLAGKDTRARQIRHRLRLVKMANEMCTPGAVPMLGQRLRRCPTIGTAPGIRVAFAGSPPRYCKWRKTDFAGGNVVSQSWMAAISLGSSGGSPPWPPCHQGNCTTSAALLHGLVFCRNAPETEML